MQTDAPTDVPAKRRRKWPWFLAGAVLLVIIGVIAVPYVYIHFIQGDPPPTLTFENIDANAAPTTTAVPGSAASTVPTTAAATTAAPAAAASTSSDSIDGTWKVASGSQAGYRVKEVL